MAPVVENPNGRTWENIVRRGRRRALRARKIFNLKKFAWRKLGERPDLASEIMKSLHEAENTASEAPVEEAPGFLPGAPLEEPEDFRDWVRTTEEYRRDQEALQEQIREAKETALQEQIRQAKETAQQEQEALQNQIRELKRALQDAERAAKLMNRRRKIAEARCRLLEDKIARSPQEEQQVFFDLLDDTPNKERKLARMLDLVADQIQRNLRTSKTREEDDLDVYIKMYYITKRGIDLNDLARRYREYIRIALRTDSPDKYIKILNDGKGAITRFVEREQEQQPQETPRA